MFCSKIGSDCPHLVGTDEKLIFVMMPFDGSTNVYDALDQALKGIEGKNYRLERADTQFTNFSIWCERICKNIRRAKYLIFDTTGRNPNVFYELGFSHAMDNTKAIIITQNIEDAPFDIADINQVAYSKDDMPNLRDKIKDAITDLDSQNPDESYANKTGDEVIIELKALLRSEEQRSAGFKKQLVETEKREKQLKEQIRQIAAIQKDPAEEAKRTIVDLEGTIGELKAERRLTEEDKRDTIDQLNKTLEEREQKLAALENELESSKASQDFKPLADTLLDDTKNRSEAIKWFNQAYVEYEKGNAGLAIGLNTKAIDLDPSFAGAYNNRGAAYAILKDYDRAIQDYNRAVELYPEDKTCYDNIAELEILFGKYKEAWSSAGKALSFAATTSDRAISLYLKCIAAKLLKMDTSEPEQAFDEVVQEDFNENWSFEQIENWLGEADVDQETKTFIAEKTNMLKKHTR